MTPEHGWEYRMIAAGSKSWWKSELDLEALNHELNVLGREGWEVVSVVATHQMHGQTRELVATLKRPRR